MLQGKIQKLFPDKGYGFIECESFSRGVFFHVRDVEEGTFDSMNVGDEVDFIPQETEKGVAAKQVKLV